MLNLVSNKSYKSLRRTALASAAFSALSVSLMGAAAIVTALPAGAVEDYSTVNLRGLIVDSGGNPIAGANVTITSNKNVSNSAVSDSAGRFGFNSLPNGPYRIRIAAAGYKTYEDSATLAPGNSSFTFELIAGTDSSSSNSEKIVVYGKRSKTKVFDRTAQGQVFNTSDLESQIPVTRGTTGVSLLAPGVTAGDTAFGFLPSTAGSAVNENTYYINGFNVTSFRNYLGFSNIPFEFFETLEVKTGGYQSEFGRATGGALITTTKSGSDEFHAGIIAYASPQSLRDTAENVTFRSALPTRVSSLNDHDYRDTSDVTVYASGALIPDHLYVYGVYSDVFAKQGDTFLTSATGGQRDELVTQDATYGVKVDAFLDPDHHFEFTHFRDDDVTEQSTYDTDGAGAITGFAGTTIFGTGGDANILRYTGKYTEWLTLSGLYGHVSYDQFAGSSADDTCPTVLDFRPGAGGAELSCSVNFLPESGGDEREAWRLDADFFYTFFGQHTTRVGYDNEKLNSVNTLKYSGGLYFRINNSGVAPDVIATDGGPITIPAIGVVPTDYVRIRRLESGGSFETTNTSWYIQDAWKIMDGPVTLLAGLRLDIFDHSNALGENFLKIEDQYAPRLGVSWDVFRDGKTKAYGFYGKYFLPIASNTNIRLAGSEEFTQSYFNCTTNPCSFNPNGTPILIGYPGYPTAPETAAGNLGTATLSPGGVQDPRKIVSANLKPMDEEEFLLGMERTMDDGWFEDWTIGLNLTYRKLGTTIEDVAVDEAMREYCIANAIAGCAAIWTGQHQYVLGNPGEDFIFFTDELPTAPGVMTRIHLSSAAMKLPPAEREYTAVELKWQRPFDGVWGLDGSYTWSRGEGNYEGGVKSDIGQTDTSLTQDFDQRATVDHAYGLLPNHREHKLKLFGSYSPIPDLVLGGNLRVESPRYFGCIGTNPAGSSSPVGATSSSWYCPIGPASSIIPTPRGSQFEGEWLSQLDLSVIYNWNMGESMGGTTATFRVDVFNVLNDGAATDFDETGELTLGTPDPNYKNTTQYQAPRSVRLGIAVRY